MDKYIEIIRVAVADGATAESRKAGAEACRAILAALEAVPGQTLGSGPSTPGPLRGPYAQSERGEGVPAAVAGLASVLPALQGMEVGQVLDLLIGRLRGMVAEQVPAERGKIGLQIPMAKIPGR